MRWCLLLLCWQLFFSETIANRHYFTSTAHITQLASMKSRLAEVLLGYADNETMRLDRVRQFAMDLQRSAPEGNLEAARPTHPVEAFLTIRRMGQDWRQLLGDCSDTDALLKASGLELPNSDDYDGAADALLRLQDVYGIPAESMARGHLKSHGADKSAPVRLTVDDCVVIVRRAFNSGLNRLGMEWVLFLASDNFPLADRMHAILPVWNILQHSIPVNLSTSNIRGLNLGKLVDKLPDFIADNKIDFALISEVISAFDNKVQAMAPGEDSDDMKHYRKLCRDGSFNKSKSPVSELVCRYTVPHPFYTLGPQKEELLNVDPRVVYLYDVLTDTQSSRLIQVADPLLKRARVVDVGTVNFRISKSAFLMDNADWSVRQVNLKLAAITGLNVTDSDSLQLGNYGIGGQYEPHMDTFDREDIRLNNRVATVLLYLSNVEQGGGTVFPSLGLRVLPVKNAALFWYNMRRKSSIMYDTIHAGCPVLEGSKWVANKWIYYLGQMHSRPCSLNQLD